MIGSRTVWFLLNRFLPSHSKPLWKDIAETLSVVYGAMLVGGVIISLVGYPLAFGIVLITPFIIAIHLTIHGIPPVVAITGLADDLGLIDTPWYFDPIRLLTTAYSGIADLAVLSEIASGTKQLSKLVAEGGVSVVVFILRAILSLLK